MLRLNHKNLEVWKLSIDIVSDIYKITRSFPKSEIFGLSNQLRRAAISISSNIAEGSARKSPTERKRFYEIARSSIVEIDTQIEISIRLEILNSEEIIDFNNKFLELFKMLSGLINKTY